MTGPLMLIVWEDAAGWSRWMDVDDFIEEEPHRSQLLNESVGWFVHEDEVSITVAPHRSDQNAIDGIMRIPKRCIREQVELDDSTDEGRVRMIVV